MTFATRHFPRLLGVVLIAAACLKSFEISSVGIRQVEQSSLGDLQAGAVVVELVLGAALLTRFWHRITLWTTVVLFLLFVFINVQNIVSGIQRCNCLGALSPGPGWMLVLDIVALGMLVVVLWRERITTSDSGFSGPRITRRFNVEARPSSQRLWHFMKQMLGMSMVALVLFAFINRYEYSGSLHSVKSKISDDRVVVVQPESWLGHALPIVGSIDLAETISEGRWQLVFVDWHCEQCRALIDSYYRTVGEESRHGRGLGQVAFVEVPPYQARHRYDGDGPLWGRLSNDVQWFIPTPLIVSLDNLEVKSISIQGKSVALK